MAPAAAIRLSGELGTLRPGAVADIVISELAEGEFEYLDVLHERRVGRERILPETVIFGGEVYDGARYESAEMIHWTDALPGFIEET